MTGINVDLIIVVPVFLLGAMWGVVGVVGYLQSKGVRPRFPSEKREAGK